MVPIDLKNLRAGPQEYRKQRRKQLLKALVFTVTTDPKQARMNAWSSSFQSHGVLARTNLTCLFKLLLTAAPRGAKRSASAERGRYKISVIKGSRPHCAERSEARCGSETKSMSI